jgi:hypothetical protein
MGLSSSCFVGLESKVGPLKSEARNRGGCEKTCEVLEKGGGGRTEKTKRKESAPLVVYYFPVQSRPGLL